MTALALVLVQLVPAGAAPVNLLVNGGFEAWAPLDAGVAAREDVRNVDLVPANTGPANWLPMRELARNQARTASIALDEEVKHSGARSARLHNGDLRDISCLVYSTEAFAARPDDARNIRPSRRYRIRWWVKGEGVKAGDAGPILMLFVMSQKDGRSYRTDAYEMGVPLPTGTFGWQQRQLVFITDESARWLTFSLQLRWAAGTVWYDDVELLDLGPVVPVETY